ncbi:hypothetical protein HOLleu_06793 [Holothuria leucospilota]|uniref:Trichohyalin-like n=1 Tax=Holothuria leucospilota TaxID=206669 RepID=A0A9Q1CLX3_HOLLE|nr:hypothetical protein HOLleu_06793 [Holothuria leucospilota]
MGYEDDLENLYQILDSPCRGFVDSQQIQDFHYALYLKKIGADQIDAALEQVCGEEKRCSKKQFVPLLLELERRRTIEERAWWDFKSLDMQGVDQISIHDTLFLFKITLGDKFSMTYWGQFMLSRNYSKEPTSFEEVKMWLCDIPREDDGVCSNQAIFEEVENLEREKNKMDYRNFKKFKALQDDDFIQTLEAREKQQYQDKFRQGARRKLNRWVQLGVESMLFDDGLDVGRNIRNSVTVQDLLEAMDVKYDILREKLIWESLKRHIGDTIWSTMSESEREEQVLKVKTKLKQLIEQNEVKKVSDLSISYQNYSSHLLAMMGYHREEQIQFMQDTKEKTGMLRADGKSEEEIMDILTSDYSKQMEGSTTCGDLLLDLHKRHMAEREFLIAVLKGVQGRVLFSAEMVSEYILYVLQQILASREGEGFEHASIVTGLSERPQEFKSDRFDADRDRHETLALERLHLFSGKRPNRVKDDVFKPDAKSKGIVDMQVEVMRMLLKKHYQEKEMIMYLLKGKESGTWRSVARRKTPEEREDKLKELRIRRSNWRQLNSKKMMSERTQHLKILFEGMGIYHETRRSEVPLGANLSDQQVSAVVMADLQQLQAQEVERILLDMQHKSCKELLVIWEHEHSAWTEEWLDNVAAIFFGTFQLTEEEREMAQLLHDKYESVREKLFLEMLVNEYGLVAVWRMSDQEKHRQIVKKKLEERELRQDGDLQEVELMFSSVVKGKEPLNKLVGNLRVLKQKQIQEKLATRKAEGRLDSDSESDSDDEDDSAGDLISDLQLRSDRELDLILAMLQGKGSDKPSQSEKMELQLRLRLETMRTNHGLDFTESALVMGLAERGKLNWEKSLQSDKRRYAKLAEERFRIRQAVREADLTEPMDKEEKVLPQQGDKLAWWLAVLQEVLKCHRSEREILLSIMMDNGTEDMRNAVRHMSQEEREQRLMELRKKADSLNLDDKGDKELNQDILEETGAIKSVLRQQILEKTMETVVTQEDVSISLLANLQETQDKEIERIIEKMHGMTDDRLSRLRMEFVWRRQQSAGKNVLVVFTQYDGVADEDSLMKALRKKYDYLKDKCLLDLLKKQFGDAEWANISERERQRRLMKLKLEEKRLRREGRMDELQVLLGGFIELDLQMHKLMGDSRAEYEDKLKKKLQSRKKRERMGLESIDEEGLSEDEEALDISSKNPLDDLQRRFEQEKEALIAKLRGAEEQYLSERERQAELARLKRELRKAQKEDDFAAAALVLGLAERNQAAAEERLKKDRERQEELARKRLEAARKKRRTITEIQEDIEETIVNNGDRAAMQDAVLKALEQKHAKERETLLVLLQTEFSQDDRLVAENISSEERAEKMQTLQQNIAVLSKKQTQERLELLLEASLLKIISRTVFLTKEGGSEVIQDKMIITIMADLQDQQDRESESLLEKLVDKENSYLVKVQKDLIEDTKYGVNKNVAVVVTTADLVKKSDDEELVEALEDKYDALRDKILAEALMKQVGAKEWATLSEKERQAKLIKLRLQERKLRQEGQYDKAAALLGDAAKNQAVLAALMGKSKKSQEEQMRERLEKRRQRMAAGMSEEEATKLEAEEVRQEEEEMKKKSENILQELENRLEEEKAELLSSLKGDKNANQDSQVENKYDALRDKVLAEALMKQMGDADWAKLSERERQAKLMKLRLEERKLRQEGKFDEAAALLGNAMKTEAALALLKEEERRERERRLRERLARRKQRIADGMSEEEIAKLEEEEEQKDDEELKERKINIMEAIEIVETEDKEIKVLPKGELEKEIEDKYDDLQDRLLAELLMKQLGAAEWARLSERERQLLIMKQKLLERRLRMEGKYDEAAALLGGLANSQKALELLREAARQEQERKLRERLARRRQRMADGMTLEEAMQLEEQEMLEEEKSKEKKPDNVMIAIETLMKEEKYSLLVKYSKTETETVEKKYEAIRDQILTDVLMKQMGDAEWAKLSEAERQNKKMQLRLQERQLRREGKYDEAASLMGEAIKTQVAVEILMELTRKTQSQRLRNQLELRQKRLSAGLSEEEVVKMETEDRMLEEERSKEKKDNVMEAIENLLDEEKNEILSNLKKPDKAEVLKEVERKYEVIRDKILTDALMKQMGDANWAKLSEEERQAKKVELKLKEREMRRLGKWEEAAAILGGAAKTEIALQVIQEMQRRKQEIKMRERFEKRQQRLGAGLTEEEIEKLEEAEKLEDEEADEEKKENVMEAIDFLLVEEKSDALADFKKPPTQEEQRKKMEKNYENLTDQILAKALMDQMGKSEWTKLSEQERQAEMMKLRMKERQLRKEGRVDEAAALLEDAAKSQAMVEAFLGLTQKSQEEKMRERLMKRKERLALGMTTKEVVALEAEEIKEEEEFLKKVEKPKNVLEAMDHRIEEEKAALMASLRKQDEKLMEERKRQAALAKLRREQRKARHEENFDAAALVIGLAQRADDAHEKDRKRQEQLAKERLEQRKKQIAARKLAKQAGQPPPEEEKPSPPGPVPLPEDANNKQALQDAVIKEMEIRYHEERDLLVQVLADHEDGEKREQARAMSEGMRQRKLSELKEQRQQWRDSGPTKEDEEEHMDILERAAALKLESRSEELKQANGTVTEEEVQIALLADLQQKQDEEASFLVQDLESKAVNTLKQLKQVQYIARANAWCDNVAATVLETKSDEDNVTEEKLVKALEGKYDALRDKLLLEALMKQIGAEEWARLTEKERQARLMKLKLQERRLRQEGKFEEAYALLGQGIQNQEDMVRLLGDTRMRQEEKLKRRIELRMQLKVQREAEGLDVSDGALDEAVIAQEERLDALDEKKTRKNILEELSNHFEEEKAALLASLRSQDERYMSERERQFALAKLRREQRMLQEEGKFSAAAALFGLSQEQEKAREMSISKDRERQKQLARSRLAAMKAKMEQQSQETEWIIKIEFTKVEILERLRQEEVWNQQLDAAQATKGGGKVGYQEYILEEVERKHMFEREALHQLIEKAEQDTKMKTHMQSLSDEDLAADLETLKQQREEWKANVVSEFSYVDGANLTGDQLEHYLQQVSIRQEEQITILRKAMFIKVEMLGRELKRKGIVSEEEIQEELSVSLLADVQQKQTSESRALTTILASSADKGDEFLIQLKESQRKSRREGWLDNLSAALFTVTEEEVTQEVIMEEETKLAKLDADLEKEKEEALKTAEKEKKKLGEDYDPDAIVAELEKQYAAKRKVMMEQLERQRQAALKKLAARKARQEDKLYEDQAAMAMLQNAEKQKSRLEESTKEQKSKHTALMQEKLAARREQRRIEEERRVEEEKKREAEQKKEEEERAAAASRDDSADSSPASSAPSSATRRDAPFGGMQREKTVVDVDMSESQKNALFTALVRDHTRAQLKRDKEQERHSEALKKRLESRKNKLNDTAMNLIGIGERQKTKLELTKKEEREKQMTMVRERIQKVKFERTQTMLRKDGREKKAFLNVLGDESESKSLSQDEKMSLAAEKMQQKFLKEQAQYKAGEISALQPDSDDAMSLSSAGSKPSTPNQPVRPKSSRILKAKDRERLLKEKRAEKKRQKEEASSASAAPDMESLEKMLEERKNAAMDATSTFTVQLK